MDGDPLHVRDEGRPACVMPVLPRRVRRLFVSPRDEDIVRDQDVTAERRDRIDGFDVAGHRGGRARRRGRVTGSDAQPPAVSNSRMMALLPRIFTADSPSDLVR